MTNSGDNQASDQTRSFTEELKIVFIGAFPAIFSLFSSLQLLKQLILIKICRWLNPKCRYLVSEATGQPTESQPLQFYTIANNVANNHLDRLRPAEGTFFIRLFFIELSVNIGPISQYKGNPSWT